MKYDIVSLGEILIDFFVNKENSYMKNAGGAPLNVAATLAKYNLNAGFIGKIGNDDLGKFLEKTLKELNIDTHNLITDNEHVTTQAFVTVDDNGNRHFSFKRDNTADLFLNKKEIDYEQIKNSKIFHFGSLSLVNRAYEHATLKAVETAKENNVIISFDPNFRENLWKNKQYAIKKITKFLQYVNILKVSTEEAQMLTKTTSNIDAINKLSKYKIDIILLTDGENGAMFKYKNYIGNIKAIKVNAVDTTGAGDIFLGAFLTCLIKHNKDIKNLSYEELLTYTTKACKLGSLSTLKYGAIPSIPEYTD